MPINISASALLNAPNGGMSGGVGGGMSSAASALAAGASQTGQTPDQGGGANLFAALLDLMGQVAETPSAVTAAAAAGGPPAQTSQGWMNLHLGDLEASLNSGDNEFMGALAALLDISNESAGTEDESIDLSAPEEPGLPASLADTPESPVAGIIEQLTSFMNDLAGRLEGADKPATILTRQAEATVRVAEYLLQRLGGLPGAAAGQPPVSAPGATGTPAPLTNALSAQQVSGPGLPANLAATPSTAPDLTAAQPAGAGEAMDAEPGGEPDLAARLRTLSADLGALKQTLPVAQGQFASANTSSSAALVAPTLADLLLATKAPTLPGALVRADAAGDGPALVQNPVAKLAQKHGSQSAQTAPHATTDAKNTAAPIAQNAGKAMPQPASPGSGNSATGTPNQPESAEPGPVAKDLRPTMNTAPGKVSDPSANPATPASPAIAASDPATNPQMTAQITATGAPTISADSTAGARPMQAAYQPPQINLPQLAFEISRQFQANNHRFEIRMDPPELGRIDVRLDVDRQGAVHARMAVERPETLDMLQRDARALERALAQAGLDSSKTSLEFSLRQNSFAGQQSGGEGRPGHAGDPTNANNAGNETDDGALAAQAINAYQGLASPGGVNLWV